MARGKKYDAAEQHFRGRMEKLEREKRAYRELYEKATGDIKTLEATLKCRDLEIDELKIKVDILLKRCGMTPEELQTAIETDSRLKRMLDGFFGMTTIIDEHLGEY